MLSGVLGIVILIGLILLGRSMGVSGESAQQWEVAAVFGAAAAGLVLGFVKLRSRR